MAVKKTNHSNCPLAAITKSRSTGSSFTYLLTLLKRVVYFLFWRSIFIKACESTGGLRPDGSVLSLKDTAFLFSLSLILSWCSLGISSSHLSRSCLILFLQICRKQCNPFNLGHSQVTISSCIHPPFMCDNELVKCKGFQRVYQYQKSF